MSLRLIAALGIALLCAPALAKVGPDEAAKLGTTLTPNGAEKAGNAEGTIPAWDGGIYLWSVLARYLEAGLSLRDAYFQALRHTGKAVVFTSLSLIVAVTTWMFSDLQYQADMGLLLFLMFTANLFGAILLLPALAWLVLPRGVSKA